MTESGGGTFELYRQTMIGDHLCDSLEAMVESGKLTEAMALTVLQQFDKVAVLFFRFAQKVS
jgi:hypothetical protein